MSENTNVVKARVRIVENSQEQKVNVLTDPNNQMYGFYGSTGGVTLYRKGEKAVDGRTIADITDKGVILSNDQGVAFLDYRNVVNLKPFVQEAEAKGHAKK